MSALTEKRIGYTRTQGKNPLWGAGCDDVWNDVYEGIRSVHELIERRMSRLKAGDTLVIVSLEEISRSAGDLVVFFRWLEDHRVHLVVLDLNLDTGLPKGKFALKLLCALEEMVVDKERREKLIKGQLSLRLSRSRKRDTGRLTTS